MVKDTHDYIDAPSLCSLDMQCSQRRAIQLSL